jgi:hypothetical protein
MSVAKGTIALMPGAIAAVLPVLLLTTLTNSGFSVLWMYVPVFVVVAFFVGAYFIGGKGSIRSNAQATVGIASVSLSMIGALGLVAALIFVLSHGK